MRSKNAQTDELCDNCGRELTDPKRLLCLDCFSYLRRFGNFPDDVAEDTDTHDSHD